MPHSKLFLLAFKSANNALIKAFILQPLADTQDGFMVST